METSLTHVRALLLEVVKEEEEVGHVLKKHEDDGNVVYGEDFHDVLDSHHQKVTLALVQIDDALVTTSLSKITSLPPFPQTPSALYSSCQTLIPLLHNGPTRQAFKRLEVAGAHPLPSTTLLSLCAKAIASNSPMLAKHSKPSNISFVFTLDTNVASLLSSEATPTIESCSSYLEIILDVLTLSEKSLNEGGGGAAFKDICQQCLTSVLLILNCTAANKDCLSKAGIVASTLAYALLRDANFPLDVVSDMRATLFPPPTSSEQPVSSRPLKALSLIPHSFQQTATLLPIMSRLALLRGAISTAPSTLEVLRNDDFVRTAFNFFLVHAKGSGGFDETLYALQGLESFINRIASQFNRLTSDVPAGVLSTVKLVLKGAQDVVFELWEGSGRQVGIVCGMVFRGVCIVGAVIEGIKLKELEARTKEREATKLEAGDEVDEEEQEDVQDEGGGGLHAILQKVLAQPSHRRGKFKALTILVPLLGSSTLIAASPGLIPSLVAIVSSVGDNANIATELLMILLKETRNAMISDCRIIPGGGGVGVSQKKIKKSDKKSKAKSIPEATKTTQISESPKAWFPVWTVPLACHLLSGSHRIRTRVAQYILPPVLQLFGNVEIAFSGAALLREIKRQGCEKEDVYVWATLAIVRLVHTLSFSSQENEILNSTIADVLPSSILQSSLVHSNSDIRLAALECLVATSSSHTPIPSNILEVIKETLHHSFKSSDQQYIGRLCSLIDGLVQRMYGGDNSGLITYLGGEVGRLEFAIKTDTSDATKHRLELNRKALAEEVSKRS